MYNSISINMYMQTLLLFFPICMCVFILAFAHIPYPRARRRESYRCSFDMYVHKHTCIRLPTFWGARIVKTCPKRFKISVGRSKFYMYILSVYVCVSTLLCVYSCVYASVHVCMYACMYLSLAYKRLQESESSDYNSADFGLMNQSFFLILRTYRDM